MKSSTSYNRFTKEIVEKKFCGVCKDAGKSKSEYTSHFIKSTPGPNGIVVCPTIIQNKCGKCNKYGHFTGHCKNARVEQLAITRQIVQEQKKVIESSYEDLFPALPGTQQTCGKKRDRNNMFTELRNIDTTIPDKVATISYKEKLNTAFIHKEPVFPHKLTVLQKGVKKYDENYDDIYYDDEFECDFSDDEFEIDYEAEFLRKEQLEDEYYRYEKPNDAWEYF